MGVKVLTLYAFSTENWKRPPIEVRFLMKLFKSYLISQLRELVEDNVQVHIVGEPSALSDDLRKEIAACEKDTAKCDGMILNVAINYGGRMEIVQAVQQIAREVKSGCLDAASISEETISAHLYPSDAQDVDLMIRTGGESRIRIFFSGRSPMGNCTSRLSCGRTSLRRSFRKRSTGLPEETVASAGSRRIINESACDYSDHRYHRCPWVSISG